MNRVIFLSSLLLLSGCIGIGLPQPMQMKPYTMLRPGDQIGRDQLANRYMAANRLLPLKGLDGNEVLTLLGQPQSIEVKQRQVSEDWYFIYYKRYKMWPKTDEGQFLVRIYHNKVIDVITLV